MLHEEEFDGFPGGFGRGDEVLGGELVREGFGAEGLEQVWFFVFLVIRDAAEGAGVVENQGTTVVEGEPGSNGGRAEAGVGDDGEVAGHLEVDAEEVLVVEAEEEVLAAAADVGDAMADGVLTALHGGGAELAASGDHAVEVLAAEAFGDGFDFGEFGHSVDLQLDGGSDGDSEFAGGGFLFHGDFQGSGGARDDEELGGRGFGVGVDESSEGFEADFEGDAFGGEGEEFGGVEVGDDVAEAVDVGDFALPEAAADADGLAGGEAGGVVDELAEAGGGDAGGEVGGGGGKDVAAVECFRDVGELEFGVGDFAGAGAGEGENVGEDAVVGGDEGVALGLDGEGAATTADAGIDDGDMDGAFGEVAPGLGEEEAGVIDLEGGDFVAKINDGGARGDGGDDAFEDAGVGVVEAEVGEEGDGAGPARHKIRIAGLPMNYFDHNATTPIAPEVLAVLHETQAEVFGNPSSIHAAGQRARQVVERARGQVAGLLGCGVKEVVLTSGGTEADNLAVLGVREGHVITAATEHPAVLQAVERRGNATVLGVDGNGLVSVEELRAALRADTVLVSIMHANNETGVVQPVEELAAAAHEVGALFHSDGVQAAGKIRVDVRALGVDLYSIAGHKFGAPKGVGALYVREGVKLEARQVGGKHERGLRAGTENVAGIAALGAACALSPVDAGPLRDLLEGEVLRRIEGTRVHGAGARRTPNTSNISFENVSAEALLIALDLAGYQVATGAACSSGATRASHVLTAMGVTAEAARGSIRFSLGRGNTREQVLGLVEEMERAVARLRKLSPVHG